MEVVQSMTPKNVVTSLVRRRSSIGLPTQSFHHQSFVLGSAGCSRYLSCSCCARIHIQPNTPASSALSTVVRSHPGTPYSHTRSPHLPLPPTLPYSPSSVPFKRHLAALETSLLSSDPEDSWSVLQALHPDLLEHLPVDTIRSIINLQSQAGEHAWKRCRAVWWSLQKSGRKALWPDHLQLILRCGLKHAIRHGSNTATGLAIRNIWQDLLSTIEARNISVDIRKLWLQYHVEVDKRRGRAKGTDSYIPGSRSREAVRSLVDAGGGEGLDILVSDMLVSTRILGHITAAEATIKLIGWLWLHGVWIRRDVLERAMERYLSAAAGDATWRSSGAKRLEKMVNLAFEPLISAGSEEAASDFRMTMFSALRASGTSPEAIAAPTQHISPQEFRRMVHHHAQTQARLWKQRKLPRQTSALVGSVRSGMAIAAVAYRLDYQLPTDFFPAMTRSMAVISTGGLLRTTVAELYRDISQTMLQAFPNLDCLRATRRVQLLTTLIEYSDNEEVLQACKLVYRILRSQQGEAEFVWKSCLKENYHKLMLSAVNSDGSHTLFISRLYSDWKAQDLRLSPSIYSALISTTAATCGQARKILLGRYVNDYLEAGHAMTEQLSMSMVLGVKRLGDAQLAIDTWKIIRNAYLPEEPPIKVPETLLEIMANSPLSGHRHYCVTLLSHLASSGKSVSVRGYNSVLKSLVGRLTKDSIDVSSRYDLARSVYHDMIKRGIIPNGKTLTYLIIAQLEIGKIDQAERTFEVATKAGIIIRSDAVGRLIGRLSRIGRLDAAKEVEKSWRAGHDTSSAPVSDKAVKGASILMSAIEGIQPDWSSVPDFKPNKYFLAHVLEVAKRAKGTSALEEREKDKETETETETEVTAVKPRVQPQTMSWVASDDQNGGGGWLSSIAL